jgi:hypothetical protein
MRLIITVVFIALMSATNLFASMAHYVDADAAGGGDGTWETPFKTIDEVNAHSFVTGDDVYFQAGDTFILGSGDRLNVTWNGTSGILVLSALNLTTTRETWWDTVNCKAFSKPFRNNWKIRLY